MPLLSAIVTVSGFTHALAFAFAFVSSASFLPVTVPIRFVALGALLAPFLSQERDLVLRARSLKSLMSSKRKRRCIQSARSECSAFELQGGEISPSEFEMRRRR